MKIKILWNIAFSLLRARRKQSLVAAIGVTFGITMFITLLSFMGGLNKMLDDMFLSRTPDVRLYNEVKPREIQPMDAFIPGDDYHHFISSVKPVEGRDGIHNSAAIIKSIQQDDRVRGVARKLNGQVFFNVGSVNVPGNLNGIDASIENQLFEFEKYIVKGEYLDIERRVNTVILGTELADKILAKIGDVVQVTSSSGEVHQLKLVALYQSGISDIDKTMCYASVETTQKILAKPSNYITEIHVKLHDLSKAPEIARQYAAVYEIEAMDIQTANAEFSTGTFVRNIISYAVGITLLIVAGFGIYNILNMMIYEKMDSIAILKATGFSDVDINRIFILIAVSIGIAGSAIGLLLGALSTLAIDQIPFDSSGLPSVTTYPVTYNLVHYVIGGTFGLITTYFAGWFPARKASKLDPVDIIRGK